MTRYALKLNLLGCGDGGAVTSAISVAGRDCMMIMQSRPADRYGRWITASRAANGQYRSYLLCMVARISLSTG